MFNIKIISSYCTATQIINFAKRKRWMSTHTYRFLPPYGAAFSNGDHILVLRFQTKNFFPIDQWTCSWRLCVRAPKKQTTPQSVSSIRLRTPHSDKNKWAHTHKSRLFTAENWKCTAAKRIKPNVEMKKLWNDNHTSSLPKFAPFVRT